MYLLRLFNVNSMCLASDTPKRSDIQKTKNALIMGTIARMFDAILVEQRINSEV